jgi:hypothetical protein
VLATCSWKLANRLRSHATTQLLAVRCTAESCELTWKLKAADQKYAIVNMRTFLWFQRETPDNKKSSVHLDILYVLTRFLSFANMCESLPQAMQERSGCGDGHPDDN